MIQENQPKQDPQQGPSIAQPSPTAASLPQEPAPLSRDLLQAGRERMQARIGVVNDRLQAGRERMQKRLAFDSPGSNEMLMRSLGEAVKSDPRLASEAQRMGIEIGYSPEMVARNIDKVRQLYLQRQTAAKVSAAFGPLRDHMLDPGFAAVAYKDVDNLSLLANLFGNWEAGQLTNERGFIGERMRRGVATEDEKARAAWIDQRMQQLPDGRGFVGSASRILGQQSTTLPEALKLGFGTGLVAAAYAGAAGQMGPQALAPEELLTVPTAFVSGLSYGVTAKMALQAYQLESGNAYVDMMQAGYDEPTANRVAVGVGIVNAALETFGLSRVAAPFKQALMEQVRRGVADELLKPTLSKGALQFAKKYAEGVAAETFTETMQEAVTMIGAEMARTEFGRMGGTIVNQEGKLLESAISRGEFVQGLIDIATQTAQGMALLGVPGPAYQLYVHSQRVAASERATQFFTRLDESASESELRELDPDRYERYVASTAANGDAKTTYVNGAKFAQVMEQSGYTFQQLEEIAPGIAKQVNDAEAHGGDVSFPTAQYAARLAGTKLGKALLPHMRLDQEAMSAQALEEFKNEHPDFVEQMKKAADLQVEAIDQFTSAGREVEITVFRQIMQTGLHSPIEALAMAEFYRAHAETGAREMNITPRDYMALFPFSIGAGEGVGAQGTMQQFAGSDALTFNEAKAAEAADRLARGEDARTVWKETGFQRGADGRLRFEIDDSAAKWLRQQVEPNPNDEFRRQFGDPNLDRVPAAPSEVIGQFGWQPNRPEVPAMHVRDVLQHDALFAAYPNVADIEIRATGMTDGTKGYFDQKSNLIVLNSLLKPEQALSTLLHEIQHAIQAREGFARGGNTTEFNDPFGEAVMLKLAGRLAAMKARKLREQSPDAAAKVDQLDAQQVLLEQTRQQHGTGDLYERQALVVEEARKRVMSDPEARAIRNAEFEAAYPETSKVRAPHEGYRRLAGEVEARTTQARQSFSALDRQLIPPQFSEDIPREEQIVLFQGQQLSPDAVDSLGNGPRQDATAGSSVRQEADGGTAEARSGAVRVGRADRADVRGVAVVGQQGTAYSIDNGPAGRQLFAELMAEAVRSNKWGASVTLKTADDLRGAQLFLTADGTAGVAVSTENEFTAGWASIDAKPGEGIELFTSVLGGVEPGVLWAESFSTKLADFYTRLGFRPVSRMSFNPEFAPEKWDYELYSPWQGGKPDVVWYVIDKVPHQWSEQVRESLPLFEEYDRGVAVARDAVTMASDGPRADNGQQTPSGAVRDGGGVRGSPGLLEQSAGQDPRGDAPLEGLPDTVRVEGRDVPQRPHLIAREAAARYMARAGLPYNPPRQYVEVDEKRARRIAQAFQDMPHDPSDPNVRMAYDAMIRETIAQWQAIKETGLVVEFIDGEDPYASNPRKAIADVVENNHLWVFPTDAGFGGSESANVDITGNPLLQIVPGEEISGRPVRANDIFRVVHDYFGHIKEGVGFRARGEENAWQQHMSMYSPLARKALTVETRGQNSWVNFGPFAESNKTATAAATQYAPQKIGVLPDWVVTEGYAGELQQPSQSSEGPRGTYNPATGRVLLNPNANLSTLLHEMGHGFLQNLLRAAAMPNASERMRADAQTFLSWANVKDLETWNALTFEQQERKHEAWAYNFEQYLYEGRAPSVEMDGLFRTFRRWLTNVYKNIRDVLNVRYRQAFGEDLPGLTKEIRAVMDRMLASEEQIAQFEALHSMQPAFTTQEMSGMDAATWAEYQRQLQEAHDASVTELDKASLKQVRWLSGFMSREARRLQAEQREVRARVKAQVSDEVMRMPVYRAERWLRSGKLLNDDGSLTKTEGSHKLNAAEVRRILTGSPDPQQETIDPGPEPLGGPDANRPLRETPEERAIRKAAEADVAEKDAALRKQLAAEMEQRKRQAKRARLEGLTAENGLPPDVVARQFGFTSGEAMVKALVVSPPIKETIESRTDDRMLREHGDLVNEQQIQGAVERAVHNEARARFLASEMRWLSKSTQPIQRMIAAAKLAARDIIEKKTVRAVMSREFSIAEAQAARATELALRKGDVKAAADLKRKQLVQNQLARLAIENRDGIEKALAAFGKFFGKDDKLAKSRDLSYVLAGRVILAKFGLGEVNGDPLELLRENEPALAAEMDQLVARFTARAKDYRELTLNEFENLREAMMMLWHRSKRDHEMQIEGRRVARTTAIQELRAQMEQTLGHAKAVGQLTDNQRTWSAIAGAFTGLKRVEHWAWYADGGKAGPVTKYIFRPVRKAFDSYMALREQLLERLHERFQKLELNDATIEAPEFGQGFTIDGDKMLLGMAQHCGNASNLENLLRDNGLVEADEEGNVDTTPWWTFFHRMIQEGRLTKAHLDYLQFVWDQNERDLKPLAQRAYRNLTGMHFEEIEASPIVTKYGTYRGGYVPSIVDRDHPSNADIPQRAGLDGIVDMESTFRQSFTPKHDFTIKRKGKNRPRVVDITQQLQHIDDVLRFSLMQAPVRDVANLLRDESFKRYLNNVDPHAISKMLIPWLEAAAKNQMTKPGMFPVLDRLFSFIRRTAGLHFMFGSLRNASQQITGFSNSLAHVKGRYLRGGIVRFMQGGAAEWVSKMSVFMDQRLNSQIGQLTDDIELLTDPSWMGNLKRWTNKHGYFAQRIAQNTVDVSTWIGAFNQAMERMGADKNDFEAQKAAVDEADGIVRMTQGSQTAVDVAAYDRASPFARLLTQFGGYFNTVLNQIVFAQRDQRAMVAVKALVMPAAIAGLIAAAFSGGDEWDDKDGDGISDELIEWMFAIQVKAALGMLPGFGPAIAQEFTSPRRPGDRITPAPAWSLLQAASRAKSNVGPLLLGDKDWSQRDVRDIFTLVSVATGIPLGPAAWAVNQFVDDERR